MNKLAAIAILVASLPTSAVAAAFCLSIQGAQPQCIYADGNECAVQATRQNGACVANPANGPAPVSRSGNYCVLMPAGYTHCGYADPTICGQDALRQRGACVKSAESGPQDLPNAYNSTAGR